MDSHAWRHLFFFFLVCGAALIIAHPVSAHTVVLLNDLKTRAAATTFACQDTVYADVIWEPPMKEPHSLKAEWRGPSNEILKTVVTPVSPDARDTWVSLALPQSSGLTRLYAPERDNEQFIGNWRVDLFLDGQLLTSKPFSIAC